MYSIIFYVPASHLDSVKAALFAKGAGKISNYDCCCWQTLGTGQYRPLPGSQPYAGAENQVMSAAEYKVEMVCPKERLKEVISALLQNHPYEVPAYAVYHHQPIDF